MPYSWLSEVLDLTQMAMDILKQFKLLFSSSPLAFVTTTLSKSHSLGHLLVNVLLLAVGCAGPHPDVHGHPETTKNNYTHYEQQLLFGKLYSKLPSIGLLIEKYLKCSIGKDIVHGLNMRPAI